MDDPMLHDFRAQVLAWESRLALLDPVRRLRTRAALYELTELIEDVAQLPAPTATTWRGELEDALSRVRRMAAGDEEPRRELLTATGR